MFHRSLLALLFTLLVASPAQAATIFITPVLPPPSDGALQCHILNGDPTKTIEYVVQILDGLGNVLINVAEDSSTLQPLKSAVFATSLNSARYCIVTLLKGSRTKVRVTISIVDSSGTPLAALEGHP